MTDHPDDFEGIIGTHGKRQGARARAAVRGGSRRGLSYEIVWDDERGRAFGSLTLRICDSPVWGTDTAGIDRDWTLLLQFLATNWMRILVEQSYPGAVTPLWPSDLSWELSRSRPTLERLDRDHHVKWFGLAHNLARFQKARQNSRSLGDVFVMREGNLMTFDARSARVRWPFADAVRSLESLGNQIASRLEQTHTGDAVTRAWIDRSERPDDDVLSISLGLPKRTAARLLQSGTLPHQTREDVLRDTSELAAAARMMGAQFDERDLLAVAKAIPELPAHPTAELDRVSLEAASALKQTEDLRPFGQGQFLALWLRRKLGLGEEGTCVDPEQLLSRWAVAVRPTSLARAIEAICVWGRTCGPAILLNPDGDHNRSRAWAGESSGGIRATLAHEICHLLLDRGRALPVVEVMGGSTPAFVEQRANAFAAEFLLPREWAVRLLRRGADPNEALSGICDTYRVSETLAARQILNHGREFLSDEQLSIVEDIVARWR